MMMPSGEYTLVDDGSAANNSLILRWAIRAVAVCWSLVWVWGAEIEKSNEMNT
jgi:hypothetical protein